MALMPSVGLDLSGHHTRSQLCDSYTEQHLGEPQAGRKTAAGMATVMRCICWTYQAGQLQRQCQALFTYTHLSRTLDPLRL